MEFLSTEIKAHRQHLLNGFDAKLSLAEAATAPSSWYVDPEFFRMESDAVLKKSWQPVAPLDWFKEPGAFRSGTFLGEPYLIVRDEQNQLRAFYNVCRHHAACLAEEKGHAKSFACPYHGWTYSLQGSLLKAPALGAVKNFRKEEMGLVPIALQVEGPFVFLNFSKSPEPFPKDWEILFKKLRETNYEKLHFVCRKEYEIPCNWKVYVDNYLDGGYHVNVLHKALAGQLDLNGYTIENFDRWTLQSVGGSKEGTGMERDRIGGGALYAWTYPNFMINRYGNIMDTNWVIPLGHDRCLTIFDYYFSDPADKKFIDASLASSDVVQQEDMLISESVQKGLASSAYQAGRYSVELESGMHLFHQWLHQDLSKVR